MTTEITTTNPFQSMESFEAAQRMAKALGASTLVPEPYRGDENIGNTLIALDMAQRMNMNPLAVMQHLHVIHGKPGWSAQFMISMFNQSGRFAPITYRRTEDSCIACSTILATGEAIEGPEVTLEMAKAEGWSTKRGSKWVTMPALMLGYRAATFLIRQTAPELTMGMQSVEEIRDVIDVTPIQEADEGLAGAMGADALPESNLPDSDSEAFMAEYDEAAKRG